MPVEPSSGLGVVEALAEAVVAADVAAHGSGERAGKSAPRALPIPPADPRAGLPPWVGILLTAIAATLAGVGVGLAMPSPSNAAGQPAGPVAVEPVGAPQAVSALKIKSGSTIDFTFSNVANSTCPPGSIQGGFGALYGITLTPGAITFTHQASSPFAPDMSGTTSGTTARAAGANNVDKQSVSGTFDRLDNPSSFIGKATLTLPTVGGRDCTAEFDAKGDIKSGAGGPAAPPPVLAARVQPGQGLTTAGHGPQGSDAAAPWLLGAGVLLVIAAVGLGWSERSLRFDPTPPTDAPGDGAESERQEIG